MVYVNKTCPRTTKNSALAVLRSSPTKPYSVLTDQIKVMGAVDLPEINSKKSLHGKKPEEIKVALIRPLGSLACDEEKEAVKEMGEPYQLELLASVLISHGYQVQIFDQLASSFDPSHPIEYPKSKSNETFVEEISGFCPDVVGISTFTYNFRKGLVIAAELKQRLGVTILFGGYHVTSVGKQFLLFDQLSNENPAGADVFRQDLRNVFQHGIVDFACIGEGIKTLPEILLAVRGLKNPREISGAAFMDDDKIHASAAERIMPDEYPLPFRANFDPMKYYATGRGYPFLLMSTASGCRFSCKYCSTGAMNYPGVLSRSIESVIQELRQIKERFYRTWPVSKIMINLTDEDFAANPRRVIALCNAISDASLSKYFEFNSFLDNLSILSSNGDEMLASMKRAGFVFCFIGIESMMDDAILAHNRPDRKFQNRLHSVQAAIDRMASHGLLYFGDHMTGFPLHNLNDLTEDYSKILQLRRMHYMYFPILASMPGTPQYWEVLWGLFGDGFLSGVTYDHLDANHQVLSIRGGGDVKQVRDFWVQKFFTRPEYEQDAIEAAARNSEHHLFFTRMLPKLSMDYPNNHQIRELARKFSI
ncbi:MAG: radical SAM protein [Candidatus Micrarchaeota archaeon]